MSHSLALLLGSRQVPRWVADTLTRAERDEHGTIERVLVPEQSSPAAPEKDIRFYLDQVRSKGCWTAVAAGQKLGETMLGPLSALERVPLSTTAPVNEELIESCRLERSSEYRYELPESAVDALTESDVAFHWGIGILSGDVLRPGTRRLGCPSGEYSKISRRTARFLGVPPRRRAGRRDAPAIHRRSRRRRHRGRENGRYR